MVTKLYITMTAIVYQNNNAKVSDLFSKTREILIVIIRICVMSHKVFDRHQDYFIPSSEIRRKNIDTNNVVYMCRPRCFKHMKDKVNFNGMHIQIFTRSCES